MTRTEFLSEVTDIRELIVVVEDNDLWDCIDELYSFEAMSNYIYDAISDMSWTEIRDWLNNIPEVDYYYRDDWGDFYDADNYFGVLRERVLEIMDEDELWEEEQFEEVVEENTGITTNEDDCDDVDITFDLFAQILHSA